LPKGGINALANHVVKVANRLAATFSDVVIAYTDDFAQHSPFLSRYLGKLRVITPPVVVHPIEPEDVDNFIRINRKTEGPAIGMAARLATEKGVEYLLGAMDQILDHHPQSEVLFAGQFEDVLGEDTYARKLAPLLDRFRDHWSFLGVLDPQQMTAFFSVCDVTVLPSVNSTESFGLVQIESMICGTPVVASNLPGVRQPVQRTGMGKVVPIRDSPALAEALLEVIENPDAYQGDSDDIAQQYSPAITAEGYERLFLELLGRS
jgi:glycosyltransferase involved in cell wall biosynthesis